MFPLPSPRLGGHPLVKRLGTTALQQLGQASLHPFQLSDPGVVRESELFLKNLFFESRISHPIMKALLAAAAIGGVAVGLALYQQQRKRAPKAARGQSKRLTTAKPEAASEAASEEAAAAPSQPAAEAQSVSEAQPVSETQPAAAQPVPLPRTVATAPVEQKASEVAVGLAEEERASRVQASVEAESVASAHRRESVSKATVLADAERSSRVQASVQASAEAEGVASAHRRENVSKATVLADTERSSRVQASAEAEGVASEHRRVSVAKATDLASAEQVG